MSEDAQFKAAFPYQANILQLPITDMDAAADWYAKHFGMVEIERHDGPCPAVIMERDGVRLGFSVNGGDATQDGAAILVSGIAAIRDQIEASGVKAGELNVEERSGERLHVFFVVAPDGLCYYFHEPMQSAV